MVAQYIHSINCVTRVINLVTATSERSIRHMTANLAVAHVVQVVGDMPNPEPEPESGQPLPPEKDAKLDHLPNALSAYRICRTLESNATSDQDRIYARILGYLILHAPTPLALAEVIRVIHSCGQDENNLSNLGKCFFNLYIRPCKFRVGFTQHYTIVDFTLSQEVQGADTSSI